MMTFCYFLFSPDPFPLSKFVLQTSRVERNIASIKSIQMYGCSFRYHHPFNLRHMSLRKLIYYFFREYETYPSTIPFFQAILWEW